MFTLNLVQGLILVNHFEGSDEGLWCMYDLFKKC